jgi:multicomponent Na+:H+ antiporter subunit E
VKANIHVAILVLSYSPKLDPVFITYSTVLKSDFYRTVFANSITLTPGTISVVLDNSTINIHCLTNKFAQDLHDNKFEKMLKEMEEM